MVTQLTEFGSGLASGSTIGPDGALYVTDPNAGSVLRVDRTTGTASTFADGLPPQVLGVGGAMDVEFIGRTAYVLVTLVGGDIVDGGPIGDATVGIYRLGREGQVRVIADIGEWSVNHPPDTDFFITTGVQYALQRHGRGFLITDGHHNRVLRVEPHGHIAQVRAFDNVVPTGLETVGSAVLMAQAGPLPHHPEDGRTMAFTGRWDGVVEIARGASLLVDVEFSPRAGLYALSQGQWDGVAEGSPGPVEHGAAGQGLPARGARPGERCRRVRDRARSADVAGAGGRHGVRGGPGRNRGHDREPLTLGRCQSQFAQFHLDREGPSGGWRS